MMAALEETLVLIREHQGKDVDLGQIPADDPKVYAMLQKADTIGLFRRWRAARSRRRCRA